MQMQDLMLEVTGLVRTVVAMDLKFPGALGSSMDIAITIVKILHCYICT